MTIPPNQEDHGGPLRFSAESLAVQDRFGTTRLARRIELNLAHGALSEDDTTFVGSMDMFFIATVGPDGMPNCSYKGGDPGFVRVLDPTHVAFPVYDGNGLYFTAGNLLAQPQVALLFICFERQLRLRLEGIASVDWDDPLTEGWHQAQFTVRVEVDRVYPVCGRYIPRMERLDSSPYVPRQGLQTPSPEWKSVPWAAEVLPPKVY